MNKKRIMKKLYFIFILIVAWIIISNSNAYEIKIKFTNLKNVPVYLGYYISKTPYALDTAYVDKNGLAVFKDKKVLPGGMYLIFIPSMKFFEIIIDKEQNFSIEADTTDFIEFTKFKGSKDNIIFYDFQRYIKKAKERFDDMASKLKTVQDEKEKSKIIEEIKKINQDRINYIKKIYNENPDLFISKFLMATVDMEVPEPPTLADGKKDSLWQYYYYRNHYFDNFDPGDPRLLRTPLYEDKIMNFLDKVIPQIPDSIIPYVDMLIEKSKHDSTLFRYMLITLFNHYAKSNIMGMDAVYIHIADKYYIKEAWWSDKKFIEDLKDKVEKTKPLLIGKIAPDIQLLYVPAAHFQAAANDTALKKYPHVGQQFNLHNLKAKYIILIFWEADCGHCKKAVPELYKIYEEKFKPEKDIIIVAVSTLFGEEGKVKWVNFVNEHKLYDWINAWNPYSYQFKLTYDITSTPQIYVLDENKKIIAKRIAVEQIPEIIEIHKKMKK